MILRPLSGLVGLMGSNKLLPGLWLVSSTCAEVLWVLIELVLDALVVDFGGMYSIHSFPLSLSYSGFKTRPFLYARMSSNIVSVEAILSSITIHHQTSRTLRPSHLHTRKHYHINNN